jgi:hypothetical protein
MEVGLKGELWVKDDPQIFHRAQRGERYISKGKWPNFQPFVSENHKAGFLLIKDSIMSISPLKGLLTLSF